MKQMHVRFVKQVVVEYLNTLSGLLREGKIDPKFAKANAQEFIDMMPFETYDGLKDKVEAFTEKHQRFHNLHDLIARYDKELQEHKKNTDGPFAWLFRMFGR